MGYRDIEILRARRQVEEFRVLQTAKETIEQECKQSIYDPVVFILKIPVEFEDRLILDGHMQIRIPTDFEPAAHEDIKKTFYHEKKPQHVYENGYLPFSFILNTTAVQMSFEEVKEYYATCKKQLVNIGPKLRILRSEKYCGTDMTFSKIESISHTLTEPVYNFMFMTSLNGYLLVGNLVCASAYMERFRPVIEEMFNSIKILTPNKEA